MKVEPPSAMTRFGMFFLASGVALIFVLWGVLKWLDQPRTPVPPDKAPASTSSGMSNPGQKNPAAPRIDFINGGDAFYDFVGGSAVGILTS